MTPMQRLRAALQAELDEPGHITKAEVQAVLDAHPDNDDGDYADAAYDSTFYA